MIDKHARQTHQTSLNFPAEKNEAVRPELNCFAVQMVSPPHFFLRFYLFCLMCLSACWKKGKTIDDFEKFCGV